ncbi:MAG TPA: cell division ATP-binding protein FtsE [Dermatophilaceae bacterium]|nr:cell division ATP-binding protein FtsE [Dermatophilaceae bacterium]
MIEFENVTKTYPSLQRPALDDVCLRMEVGEFAFLVGASGSGKSTVMRLILREERATSGRIVVAGHDLQSLKRRGVPALRRAIGMVFQDFRLLPDKTVFDNVAYVMHVLGARRRDVRRSVPETLELVGLAAMAKRFPHQLSGGEQQRVAIARAVVTSPPLLLADEPTGNLDPVTSLEIVGLLDRINKAGTTVLMATHDDDIVDHFRKRVMELDAGRMVRDEAVGVYLAGGSTGAAAAPAATFVEAGATASGTSDTGTL